MTKKIILFVIMLLLIGVAILLYCRSQKLHRTYEAEVIKGLSQMEGKENQIVTEEDLLSLPKPVQKYLRVVGAVGREKVWNFRMAFAGEMKPDPNKDWMKINSVQYNFFNPVIREFYISGNMFYLPVLGLHSYTDEQASMRIKVAGLITVSEVTGREMEVGETVTVFNDMCLLAPATLIDPRISWETIDDLSVKATFDNNGRKISAILYFNEQGELINFVSQDRYMTEGKNLVKLEWSTPVTNYVDDNGIRRPAYGEAIWTLPNGDKYCYARFYIAQIEYNCRSFY